MVKVSDFELSQQARQNRYFSKEFKVERVREIERGLASVGEVSRAYHVSRPAVYKWLYKYSTEKQKQPRMIVENKSSTKKIQQLKERIKELEQLVGQKQVRLEFQDKMIEIASQELGVDIKKNFSSRRSSGTGRSEENTV